MANTKITSGVIAADAVLTANITDANVTTAKIADDAVTSAKLDTNIAIAGTLDVAGAVVFNEGSADVDFRVEGNARANLLVVDGGKDMIGVGMQPDQSWGSNSVGINFGIADGDAGAITWQEISGADSFNFSWNAYNDNTNWKYASGNPSSRYYQLNGEHVFTSAVTGNADANITFLENLSLSSGASVFNDGSVDMDFRVESNGNANMIFVDGGNDKVGIGVGAPTARLSLPAQASGDSGVARFAIESAVDSNDFTIAQYEDGTGTYTQIGQNISLNSGGNVAVLDSGHKTAGITFDGRGNGSLMFQTGAANANTEKLRITSVGNLHLNGGTDARIQLGSSGAGANSTDNDTVHIRGDGDHMKLNVAANGSFIFEEDGTERMKIDSAGHVTAPFQPAFSAKPANQLNNLAVGQNLTLDFDSEIFDQNGDYNTTNATFTAPRTGKYQFNVEIYFQSLDIHADYYQLALITHNRTYNHIISPEFSGDPAYFSLNLSILADMDANDTAYVQMQVGNNGAAQADIAVHSFFTGFLAC